LQQNETKTPTKIYETISKLMQNSCKTKMNEEINKITKLFINNNQRKKGEFFPKRMLQEIKKVKF
jgi:hypothetical protein